MTAAVSRMTLSDKDIAGFNEFDDLVIRSALTREETGHSPPPAPSSSRYNTLQLKARSQRGRQLPGADPW